MMSPVASVEPMTLAEAYERIIEGISPDIALLDFLDAFDRSSTIDAVSRALTKAPPLTGNQRLDALAAAIADYLAHQHRLTSKPSWAFEPIRCLSAPWHTCASEDHGLREYLAFASPGEFKSRQIFTDERPLRCDSRLIWALKKMRSGAA